MTEYVSPINQYFCQLFFFIELTQLIYSQKIGFFLIIIAQLKKEYCELKGLTELNRKASDTYKHENYEKV